MASQVTTTLPGEKFEKLKTSGKLLNHRHLRLAEDGEILVQGDTLFKGYVRGSRHKLNVDLKGWFASGDLGFLDSDGYLTVTGRKDNMFISGGENIHPEEIERVFFELNGVNEAVVVPVKNDEFGYRPVAFINMDGKFPNEDFFNRFLVNKIPHFKIPDYFLPFPDEDQFSGIKPNRLIFSKIAEKFLNIED
jgi:O-succinylbenzoic acid--CoA ligase